METKIGRVKWFNNQKGFGFIEGDQLGDIFVHHTDILAEGYRSLKEGDMVEYQACPGPKGLKAAEVRRVEVGPAIHRSNSMDAQWTGFVSELHPRHQPERG